MTDQTKIIFLDIDGPVLPGRCMFLPGQTLIMEKFDPVAVSLLNKLCDSQGPLLPSWKIVIHSSWLRIMGAQETLEHCIGQGLHHTSFHPDAPTCSGNINCRYTRVAKWLKEHPEVTEYVILDDEPYSIDLDYDYPHPENMGGHLILIDYDDGLRWSDFKRIRDWDMDVIRKDYKL